MVVANKEPALVQEGPPLPRSSSRDSCRGIRVSIAVAPLAIPGRPALADVFGFPVPAVGPAPLLQVALVLLACTGVQSVTRCDPG